jgi:uncharacterized protein YdeI (YjbR/CyaY-like superfamily)
LELKNLKMHQIKYNLMENALYFPDKQRWRNWLSENHSAAAEAWLVFYKKNSAKQGLTLPEAVEEAICFGWIDGKLRRIDEERFALRFSPRKAGSVWSKINKERAQKLIDQKKMAPAGLATVEDAKKSGKWDNAYTNQIRDAVPSDLKEALTREPVAWKNFKNFANSYQNMYVGWVLQAKTQKTRQMRIEKVVAQANSRRAGKRGKRTLKKSTAPRRRGSRTRRKRP